ncbi:hypothetical protein K3148_11500 [Qipengyuania aurantiaca]|uniref:Uncharacterized protein n=1 Tax=Qipengyuania aurantiaca TaxID=2867233 RepID=A0ABX8ZKA0_9SPHN|nr:hypothetical protein [Qipengyuania aurantiaca]QZD89430.1 hypothetical protein K3148_11500 [Qipengyuania aurantiaca]
MIDFELTFEGGEADKGSLEFYDASKALAEFQRSLALTTHLVLHGEIITQAPSAKGFQIFVPPFEEGSWKTKAKVLIGGAFLVGSVGKDSPVGHMVTSVYDLVLQTTMGFSADYDKTLQELYLDTQKNKIGDGKIDSLCEKVETSVADMHRPIVASKTATRAQITRCDYQNVDVGPLMSPLTYEYVKQTKREEDENEIVGYVSSYNINTYTGRIYSVEEDRPIPFELHDELRDKKTIGLITRSQHFNGQNPFDERALITFICNRLVSANGKVKRLIVLSVHEGDASG